MTQIIIEWIVLIIINSGIWFLFYKISDILYIPSGWLHQVTSKSPAYSYNNNNNSLQSKNIKLPSRVIAINIWFNNKSKNYINNKKVLFTLEMELALW